MRLAPLLAAVLALPLTAQAPAMVQDTEPEPSILAVPIRIELGEVFAQVERTAPRRPPGVQTWAQLPGAPNGVQFRYDLSREALRFSLRDNHLLLRTEASYWLEVGAWMAGRWVQPMGSCGKGKEPPRRMILGLRCQFDLTPDWRIDLQVTPDEPLPIGPCQLTFIGYDITDKVAAGMRAELGKAAQAMARQVSEATLLQQQAERIWSAAQAPLELAPGIHLALNPERLRLAPWRSEGRTLLLTPEIQARPQVVFGDPPPPGRRPLPTLETAVPVTPGFKVRLDLDLPYASATRQLQAQLVGRRFDTEQGPFEILDTAVQGRDGRAVLKVRIKGRIEGELTLSGRPVYDPVQGHLRLEELDYTLESRSWITRAGEWLFRSSLRRTLQEKADWFLERSFAEVREQLNQGLNRELRSGIRIQGALGQFQLGQPRLLEDRFRVEAVLSGAAALEVRGLASHLAGRP